MTQENCGCPEGSSYHTAVNIYNKVIEIAKEYETLKDRWHEKDPEAMKVINDIADNKERLLEIMRLCVFEYEWYKNKSKE